MNEENWELPDNMPDDFGFVEAYDDEPSLDERMLEENTAPSAINCAFVGVGGGYVGNAIRNLRLAKNTKLPTKTLKKAAKDKEK